MTLQSIADNLRASFQEVLNEQNALAEEIANMLAAWDTRLAPIKSVMAEYGVKYTNPHVSGETAKGVILGGDDEKLFVLSGNFVKAIDPKTDEVILAERTYSLAEFAKFCDLNTARAGFESVTRVGTMPALKRNNELSDFLRESKSYLLNKND